MIRKVLQQPSQQLDTANVKKTCKKIKNAKIQRSLGKETQVNGRMDLETDYDRAQEDSDDDRIDMNLEVGPIGSVIGLMKDLTTNNSGYLTNSMCESFEDEQLCKTNQEQFDRFYGTSYSNTLKKNVPNLEDLLRYSKISKGLRAKMLDWMMEVVNYFKPNSDDFTFFKALTVMDLFIKNNQRWPRNPLTDQDVHLIGLTSIFIASKYEDNRHVPLQSLLADACKGKFNPSNVLNMEWEILLAIGFNSSIPTHLECLDSILSSIFQDLNGELYHQIRYFAIYLLKRSLYFTQIAELPMHILATASLILSVHSNFDGESVRLISERIQNPNIAPNRALQQTQLEQMSNEKHTLVSLHLFRLHQSSRVSALKKMSR